MCEFEYQQRWPEFINKLDGDPQGFADLLNRRDIELEEALRRCAGCTQAAAMTGGGGTGAVSFQNGYYTPDPGVSITADGMTADADPVFGLIAVTGQLLGDGELIVTLDGTDHTVASGVSGQTVSGSIPGQFTTLTVGSTGTVSAVSVTFLPFCEITTVHWGGG